MLQRFLMKYYPEQWPRYQGELAAGRFSGTLDDFIREFAPDIYQSYLLLTRPAKILAALLSGLEIRHDGQTYCMDADYRLCVKGWSINSQTGQRSEKLLVVDMGDGVALSSFVKMTMKFTEDELFVIGANMALNRM